MAHGDGKVFKLVGAGIEQKTKFASYFLKGEANYWWDPCEHWKDGDLTVAEYEAKFTKLERFVPDRVDTDEKKARRFEQGLRFWNQNRVAMFELTSYVAVVQKAMVIESKSDMSQKGNDGKKRKIKTSGRGQQQAANVARIEGPPTKDQPKAWTFNMTMKDAIQSSDMVAGTLPVNSIDAKVLFDYGATRSFISQSFVDKLHYEVKLLEQALMIELANKNQVSVDRVCPRCDIEIGGHHFYANLIPFKLGKFDIILGMDWLSENNAQIDYKNRKGRLQALDRKKRVIFRGNKQEKNFLTIA
ncbi:hypothetical protein AgCh_021504 [Apium graveolens]